MKFNKDAVLAIDPGTWESGWIMWQGKDEQIIGLGKWSNDQLLEAIIKKEFALAQGICRLVVEEVKSYGRAVNFEVLDTIFWSGRFAQAFMDHGGEVTMLPRQKVASYITQGFKGNDTAIRNALIERYGRPPTKKHPNYHYNGFKPARDEWQAWALAVAYYDVFKDREIMFKRLIWEQKNRKEKGK